MNERTEVGLRVYGAVACFFCLVIVGPLALIAVVVTNLPGGACRDFVQVVYGTNGNWVQCEPLQKMRVEPMASGDRALVYCECPTKTAEVTP